MARAVHQKHSAVDKCVSNGPRKPQWRSSPLGLCTSIAKVCDFQNLSELSKKLISLHSPSWKFFFPLALVYQLSSLQIKEKNASKLFTKVSTQGREGKRHLLLFFLDISVAHHYYDYRAYIYLCRYFKKKKTHKLYLDISGDSITTENWHSSLICRTW